MRTCDRMCVISWLIGLVLLLALTGCPLPFFDDNGDEGDDTISTPTGVTATAVSESAIDVTWTDTSNNEDGFSVERSDDGGATWTQVGTVGAGITTYSDTGLTAYTTYHYRVRAYVGTDFSNYSNSISTTTQSVGGGGGGSGAWTTEVIHNGSGYETDILIDSSGTPHIAVAFQGGGLKYMTYDGTTWGQTVIDTNCDAVSMVFDASEHIHLAYFYNQYGSYSLRYAYYNGTSWATEIVDDSGNYYTGGHASIALGSSDQPRIAYQFGNSLSDVDLYYASYDGTQWNTEMITGSGVQTDISLLLDSSDIPHIVYQVGQVIKYVTHNGTNWTGVSTVSTDADNADAIIDSTDTIQVAYQVVSAGDLGYATYDGTTWTTGTAIASAEEIGRGPGITIDTNNRPHVVYRLWTDNPGGGFQDDDLWYAYYDGTAWQSEAVDEGDTVGYACSVALDDSDVPHMVYHDAGGFVKYAK